MAPTTISGTCLNFTLHRRDRVRQALDSDRHALFPAGSSRSSYALNTAALSGLDVDIVIPERGNLRLVTWAMWGQIEQVLDHGARVWLSPATPFDHTKLMVVDDYWVLFGSTNWDPRSLRLNFEFNVECYDRDLARQMTALVRERIHQARRLERKEITERSLPLRLRDGAARLLTPYL